MNMKKKLAMIMSVMMLGAVATACGDSNKSSESKTPHTTYSVDDINNMSNDELEKALENAASEIEMSEKAERESAEEESEAEAIDMWKDVEVTFIGGEDAFRAEIEYVGDNPIIKDNVIFSAWCTDPLLESVFVDYDGYENGCEEFCVYAGYDEEKLKDAGVVLKKRRYEEPEKSSRMSATKETDFCFYTISGLARKIEITDDTDTSMFVDALNAITERVKEEANSTDSNYFSWARDTEIYPTQFYLYDIEESDMAAILEGAGYIAYSDKDGNLLKWVEATKLLYFNDDGTWNKDAFLIGGSVREYGNHLMVNEEALLEVEIN